MWNIIVGGSVSKLMHPPAPLLCQLSFKINCIQTSCISINTLNCNSYCCSRLHMLEVLFYGEGSHKTHTLRFNTHKRYSKFKWRNKENMLHCYWNQAQRKLAHCYIMLFRVHGFERSRAAHARSARLSGATDRTINTHDHTPKLNTHKRYRKFAWSNRETMFYCCWN